MSNLQDVTDVSRPTFVVAVDGSPASRSALRLALDEALPKHGIVRVVTCWSESNRRATGFGLPSLDSYDNASRVLRKTIFEVTGGAAELRMVVRQVDEGRPGPLLTAAARHATALFVGAPTRRSRPVWNENSVGAYCAHHSRVPVVVVPAMETELESLDLDEELRDHDRAPTSV